jgi:protein phosphatase
LIAQIGDSRIYRLRGTQLEQLTRDHSLVWELRELGQKESMQVPKNVITRSLGPNANVEADIEGPMSVEVGDVFLLCSDGLTGKIEDHELAAVLAHLPPDEAAQFFVNLANLRGGPDNITAVIVKVTGPTLATGSGPADPLKIGASASRGGSKDFLVWVAAAVFGLAVLVLFITNNPIPAAIAAIAAVTLTLVGLLAPTLRARRGVVLADGRRLGRGPYTRTNCPPDDDVLGMLSKICGDLRRIVEQREMGIDLNDFESHCDTARQAEQAGKKPAAVLEYARAVRVLMHAVREEQRKEIDDSAIEL